MKATSVLHPAHQRIVDVRAIGVAGLVAREQRPEDGLGPGRQREHGMLGEPRLDERAHALEVGPLACLQVRLDELRRPPGRGLAVDEGRGCQPGAHLGNVGRGQDIGDGEDHVGTHGVRPLSETVAYRSRRYAKGACPR